MKKIHNVINIFLAIVLVCGAIFAPQSGNFCRAATKYSDVLDDLIQDSSFNPEVYPQNDKDNNLYLIQLAESSDKELFLYVYQPSGQAKDFKASYVKLSTTVEDDVSFSVYRLEFLNSNGVFYKYKVLNFTVKDDAVRYYSVSSIHRPFDKNVDDMPADGQTINHVAFDVSKQYEFGSVGGEQYVHCLDIETIEVTDKFVGFVRYPDGYVLYSSACDSHFVAFNTDKPIDKLVEADVWYTTQSLTEKYVLLSRESEFGEKDLGNYAQLEYTESVEHSGGLLKRTYTWKEIQTVDEFISSVNIEEDVYSGALLDVTAASVLTDEALDELKGKKWVLRFTNTSFSTMASSGMTFYHSTIVGDVTILRLKFETEGVVYNLGVIDNFQTGSSNPANSTSSLVSSTSSFKTILALFMAILIILLFAPVLPYVIRAIVFVVTLPIRIIKQAVRRNKK